MTTAVSGTITESLTPTDWIVRTSRLDTGAFLADTAVDTTSSGAYSATCGAYTGPVMATCYPKIGRRWAVSNSTSVSDCTFPTNCQTTPYFFKATTAPVGDTYFSSVKLLLHCDGSNGGTTFTDVLGHTPTRGGSAQTSTVQYKYGTASLLLNGSTDYLTFPDSADFELAGNDFTLEAWIRFTGYAGNTNGYAGIIISKDSATERGVQFGISGTASSYGSVFFTGYDNSNFTTVSVNKSFNLNQWYHVAATRYGNFIYFFVDGVLLNVGGSAFSRTIRNQADVLAIGKLNNPGYEYYFKGYLDDIRITNGVARYTSDFTAPTAAFLDSAAALTGGSEPAWDATTGNTTVDNQVTWTCMGPLIQPITHSPVIPV